MPVLVVGAQSAAGRAAVRALARAGGEVRAFADAEAAGEPEAEELRALGAKVAVGDLDDEAHLEAALEQVHTVVHLAGDPFRGPSADLEALAGALSAALGAGCRRLVWATELAAAEPGGNRYLASLADGQAMLEDAPLETVTLRCAIRYARDDGFSRRLAAADLAGADRDALHAPLHVDDLAEAVRAADRQRATDADLHLAVELAGPEEVTLGAFQTRLRAAVGGAAAPQAVPEWVAGWLSRPAAGGPDALGRSGKTIAEGLGEG